MKGANRSLYVIFLKLQCVKCNLQTNFPKGQVDSLDEECLLSTNANEKSGNWKKVDVIPIKLGEKIIVLCPSEWEVLHFYFLNDYLIDRWLARF